MIKLKDLLTEEMTTDQAKAIIGVLEDAEDIIVKEIKRHPILKKGKIKWVTNKTAEYPGHINFEKYSGMDKNAFIIQLKVIVSIGSEDYIAEIYTKAYVNRKGDIMMKANVFESSGQHETFKDENKLYRYLKDAINNFQFMKRIKQ